MCNVLEMVLGEILIVVLLRKILTMTHTPHECSHRTPKLGDYAVEKDPSKVVPNPRKVKMAARSREKSKRITLRSIRTGRTEN